MRFGPTHPTATAVRAWWDAQADPTVDGASIALGVTPATIRAALAATADAPPQSEPGDIEDEADEPVVAPSRPSQARTQAPKVPDVVAFDDLPKTAQKTLRDGGVDLLVAIREAAKRARRAAEGKDRHGNDEGGDESEQVDAAIGWATVAQKAAAAAVALTKAWPELARQLDPHTPAVPSDGDTTDAGLTQEEEARALARALGDDDARSAAEEREARRYGAVPRR